MVKTEKVIIDHIDGKLVDGFTSLDREVLNSLVVQPQPAPMPDITDNILAILDKLEVNRSEVGGVGWVG